MLVVLLVFIVACAPALAGTPAPATETKQVATEISAPATEESAGDGDPDPDPTNTSEPEPTNTSEPEPTETKPATATPEVNGISYLAELTLFMAENNNSFVYGNPEGLDLGLIAQAQANFDLWYGQTETITNDQGETIDNPDYIYLTPILNQNSPKISWMTIGTVDKYKGVFDDEKGVHVQGGIRVPIYKNDNGVLTLNADLGANPLLGSDATPENWVLITTEENSKFPDLLTFINVNGLTIFTNYEKTMWLDVSRIQIDQETGELIDIENAWRPIIDEEQIADAPELEVTRDLENDDTGEQNDNDETGSGQEETEGSRYEAQKEEYSSYTDAFARFEEEVRPNVPNHVYISIPDGAGGYEKVIVDYENSSFEEVDGYLHATTPEGITITWFPETKSWALEQFSTNVATVYLTTNTIDASKQVSIVGSNPETHLGQQIITEADDTLAVRLGDEQALADAIANVPDRIEKPLAIGIGSETTSPRDAVVSLLEKMGYPISPDFDVYKSVEEVNMEELFNQKFFITFAHFLFGRSVSDQEIEAIKNYYNGIATEDDKTIIASSGKISSESIQNNEPLTVNTSQGSWVLEKGKNISVLLDTLPLPDEIVTDPSSYPQVSKEPVSINDGSLVIRIQALDIQDLTAGRIIDGALGQFLTNNDLLTEADAFDKQYFTHTWYPLEQPDGTIIAMTPLGVTK